MNTIKKSEINYYQVLGVTVNADFYQIMKAYRKRVEQCKTHNFSESDNRFEKQQKILKILEKACNTLTIKEQRKKYDQLLLKRVA